LQCAVAGASRKEIVPRLRADGLDDRDILNRPKIQRMNAMESANKLIDEIIQSTCENIPSNSWENFSLTVYALNKMIQVQALYQEKGTTVSFDPEENGIDVVMKIKSLREELYKLSPDKGAWYSAYFTVDSTGKFQTNFDYESKPDFSYTPDIKKFVDDLKTFPRDEALVPQWLREIVGGSGVPVTGT
jgi:hypothetical protein